MLIIKRGSFSNFYATKTAMKTLKNRFAFSTQKVWNVWQWKLRLKMQRKLLLKFVGCDGSITVQISKSWASDALVAVVLITLLKLCAVVAPVVRYIASRFSFV